MKDNKLKGKLDAIIKRNIMKKKEDTKENTDGYDSMSINNKKNTKDDPQAVEQQTGDAAKEGRTSIKAFFRNLIQPEEQTFRNYFDIDFWMNKRRQYIEMREKERKDLNVYEILSQGAYPTIEYYILTILSCIIATAGLLQGSTATIIGAMIVAPLMTPILAFSLGIIWGDAFLIRISLKSLVKGIGLAVIISAVIAFVIPTADYSPEILSRTHPSIFDIIVALVSGMVGAYGYANKNISATLVGIAIAVALMPPLCTVGIGLGTMNMSIAGGASVLFVINLVSISLAGAVVFLIMKIHPQRDDESRVRKRALYQIVISIIILTCIAIPVGYFMREGFLMSRAKKAAGELILRELPGSQIMQIQQKGAGDSSSLDIVLSVSDLPSVKKINEIKKTITLKFKKLKHVDIRLLQVSMPHDQDILNE
ncbi:MAG TPA: TIGR00341 family protein [Spirochaetota bacterium]|nr:TIGR00341 family protein [Spirochaetota bacterium]HRT77549.1 TIGR00341 family protein [Spirochaetota bacterium]